MLLSPNQLNPSGIHTVLKESGIVKPERDLNSKDDLQKLLRDSNLSKEEVLSEVGLLMRTGETGSVRISAAKIGLQLNGLGSDEEIKVPFQVNIIIKDSQFTEVNPILIPR